jgi:hypothetical protein
MHKFLKFIFGIELYMFRTGFLSIIRSLVLYMQNTAVSSQHNLYDIYLLLCVYTARLLMMDRETV